VMLTTHPLLAPRLRKTLWVLLGLLRGSLYSFYNIKTEFLIQRSYSRPV
jgi:hypothetical protein